jgi:hypothetical protein
MAIDANGRVDELSKTPLILWSMGHSNFEIDEFIDLATGSDTPKRKSLVDLSDPMAGLDEIVLGNDSTMSYMENMVGDVERPLDDWSMFYCGSASPIVRNLQCIERKYHIGLGIEKFDW